MTRRTRPSPLSNHRAATRFGLAALAFCAPSWPRAALSLLACCQLASARVAESPPPPTYLGGLSSSSPLNWWALRFERGQGFCVAELDTLSLLSRFADPSTEREKPGSELWRHLFRGQGRWFVAPLRWDRQAPSELGASAQGLLEPRLDSFALLRPLRPLRSGELPLLPSLEALDSQAPWSLPIATKATCAPWARPRVVWLTSPAGEQQGLRLLDCDGSVKVDSLDAVSVLGRVQGTPAPTLPFALLTESTPGTNEEWAPGVRHFHPRLLWLLTRIADAFPGHRLRLVSGYRREDSGSPHTRGRALDLSVEGIANERVFAFCRSLKDMGCGYYPYHPFVHFDVRPPGQPPVYWVDASSPGEPSIYVEGWPGVVKGGATVTGASP